MILLFAIPHQATVNDALTNIQRIQNEQCTTKIVNACDTHKLCTCDMLYIDFIDGNPNKWFSTKHKH